MILTRGSIASIAVILTSLLIPIWSILALVLPLLTETTWKATLGSMEQKIYSTYAKMPWRDLVLGKRREREGSIIHRATSFWGMAKVMSVNHLLCAGGAQEKEAEYITPLYLGLTKFESIFFCPNSNRFRLQLLVLSNGLQCVYGKEWKRLEAIFRVWNKMTSKDIACLI